MVNVPLSVLAPGGKKHLIMQPQRQKRLEEYRLCLNNKTGFNDADCLPMMLNTCKDSHFTSMKTIRFQMNSVAELLEREKGIKIIHLVRDPRASLLSKMYVREIKSDLKYEASTRCLEMMLNIQKFETLSKKYPDRLFQVLYEDFVDHPFSTTKEIYKFLGFDMPETLHKWIHENMYSNMPVFTGPFSTKRTNSNFTAHAWKRVMPIAMAMEIENVCSQVLAKLKYEKFEDILKEMGDN